jgi:hypothetical protein
VLSHPVLQLLKALNSTHAANITNMSATATVSTHQPLACRVALHDSPCDLTMS